ncbi:hypothetical protein [Microbacterium telephonicum]|uniref:Uncharacterized protein n=1 Tax=Microbacterium telephonicum TaxID=1714841 RepID=A0A498BTY4_9MICO|nr:hypothetical protein [Microbacterium telephonicum]RLK46429.1 hypothetical protein C7474_2967 [Microbacterium telephonicum]
MAIKKRTPVDPAKIEAFGAAADAPTQEVEAPAPAPKAQPASRPAPRATSAGEWPEGTSKTFLLRWSKNPELPALLAEVAELEDRTQQKTALRALQRGLEVIRAEHKG